MKIAIRLQVTDRLFSYRLLDGTRIGFSPDSRIVHLPWCNYCVLIPLLGWIRGTYKKPKS